MKDSKGRFIKGNNFHDLTGQQFGRLIVLRKSDKKVGRKTYWKCKCSCGNEKDVRSDCLISGDVKSCGCLKKEQDIKNLDIDLENHHNLTNHPLFKQWNTMNYRCENNKCHSYGDYGGRGIKVCEEWKDVRTFIKWAEGNGYKKGLTIERIDVNKGYSPENCMFITMRYQSFNKRNTVYGSYKGKLISIAKFAFEHNLKRYNVYYHNKKGLPLDLLI